MQFGHIGSNAGTQLVMLAAISFRVAFTVAVVIRIDDTQCGRYNLLGPNSGQQSHIELPVESLWFKHGLYDLPYAPDEALLLLLLSAQRVVVREIAQRPDNDAGYENDAPHFLEILFTLVPSVTGQCLGRGKTIRRQLHDKRCVLALEHHRCEELTNTYGHQDAYHVQRHHDEPLCFQSKKGSYNHDVYRNACLTAHQRQDEHCDQSRPAALYGSRSHNGRYITAKTHDKRNERFAVKPHFMHQAIHDKCRTRHVAGVFHERYKEIENEDLRQKNNHRPHTTKYAIYKHGLDRAGRQISAHSVAQPAHERLYPVHGIGSERESGKKHDAKHKKKNGKPHNPMGQYAVEQVSDFIGIFLDACMIVGLFECTVDESILGIHYQRLGVRFGFLHHTRRGFVTMAENGVSISEGTYIVFNLLVVFQQFYGQVSGGKPFAHMLSLFQVFLYISNAGFHLVSMVDVDMAKIGLLILRAFIYSNHHIEQRLHPLA